MATRAEYKAAIDQTYWAWLQTRAAKLAEVQNLIREAVDKGWTVAKFTSKVQALPSFVGGQWQSPEGDTTPHEHVDSDGDGYCDVDGEPMLAEPEGDWGENLPTWAEPDTYDSSDVRATLADFMQRWGLQGLTSFVENAIANRMSAAEIMIRLRETPEYQAAFPENAMRKQAGLSWWSESQILEYRDTARRLASQYLGITDISNQEIASLVAREVALPEWERRLQTYKAMQQWGPSVKMALEQELGYAVSDDRVFAFMNPDIPTPELDRAYQIALMRGQPAGLGFGLRPAEEAQMLREFGYSPEEAFKGYQGIASELPRQERLTLIENYMNAQSNQPDVGLMMQGTTFGELFRAIQLKDAEAIQNIQQRMAREFARWAAGGGPVRSGTAAVGLLTAAERR